MNQAKKEKLVKELIALSDNPNFFANTGEKFKGDEDCIIWTGNEETFKGGLTLRVGLYGCENHPVFEKFLNDNKLFAEPYDAGTIMVYEE